jgi:hypothetical protein
MADSIDRLLAAATLAPSPNFAQRITALARQIPQYHSPSPIVRLLQWASLGAGAGFGALLLGEFMFFAFVAVGAQ